MVRDFTMRDATRDDLPEILRMLADDPLGHAREIVSDPPARAYVEAFEAICADPNNRLLVAELEREVVGTLQLSFLPGLARGGAWRGQIEAVRTSSTHRGRGIGGAMFRWAIDASAARGCALVQLTTDASRTEAHRFYDRLGFVPSHIGFKLQLSPEPQPEPQPGS